MKIACILLALGASAAQDPARGVPELEQQVRQALKKHETPGAGIAIVNRQGDLWIAGVGNAAMAAERPVTGDTPFRIGSISKGFAALAVMMLVEEGKLSLDDPVRRVAPEVQFGNPWEAAEPVRVVHLLEHTTGWDDLTVSEYAHNQENPIQLRDALDFRPVSRTSRWPPGSGQSYCNSGPAVAAYIVEKLAGKRFEDFVAERIFRPLGMGEATYFRRPGLPEGYADGKPVRYWNIMFRPSGSINASAREMAPYVRMYLNRGAGLVKPESIARIETPGSTPAARLGLKYGYGLCNYSFSYEDFTFHGHDGGMEGFVASMGYLPDAGLGFVAMINTESDACLREIRRLIQGYLVKDLSRPPKTPAVELPPAGLAAWAGYYEPMNSRRQALHFMDRLSVIRVRAEGGRLLSGDLLRGSATRLAPVGGGQFRPERNGSADRIFTRDPAGTRLMLLQGSVFREVPGALVWGQAIAGSLCILLMASSLLYALWWVPRWLLKAQRPRSLSALLWPLVAALCLAGIAFIFAANPGTGAIWRLGNLTAWSGALFLFTTLLPLASVAGLMAALRARRKGRPWRYSLLCSLAGAVISAYLGYWGFLAVRTWV
jgi:CubicO group peptidase (beta-lactamase class C family)